MKYLSVCSGIEAATVAWHHMGWEPVAFSEIEKFPSAVLAHHYPNVPNWGDMTKYKEWPDANVDVLVGGTPCQSFSVAGLRKGLDDPRGNLMLTYLAIAKRYRPEWLVWENVPGVLSSEGGRDFAALLRGLDELGYGWAYRVLDAQYFGVAQRRRRVFVVGHLGNWQRAAAVLFERHSLSGHPAPSRQARKGTAGGLAAGFGTGSNPEVMATLCAKDADKWGCNQWVREGKAVLSNPTVTAFDAFNQADTGDLSKTVASRNDQDTASLVSGCWWDGGDLAATITTKSDDQRMPDKANAQLVLEPVAIQGTLIGRSENSGPQGSGADVSGAMFTLTKTDVHAVAHPVGVTIHGTDGTASVASYTNISSSLRSRIPSQVENSTTTAVLQPMAMRESGQGYWMEDNIAGTLRAEGEDRPSRPSHVIQQTAMQVRRLTPVECERLQGFPDGYTNIPWRGKPESPDGPRYKALGNSMAVPVMSWIGERINEVSKL